MTDIQIKDEMDILREIGSISAAHGSTALSEMLGRPVKLSMPSLQVIYGKDLARALAIEGPIISLHTQMLTGLNGKIIFILEEKSSYKFVDICYKSRSQEQKPSSLTEMSMSIIKEIGNIVTSAYVNSLGYYLKKLIIPSLPVLMNAPFSEIIKMSMTTAPQEQVLVIESVFEEKQEKIKGNFWLILSHQAAQAVQDACKKYLEDLNRN